MCIAFAFGIQRFAISGRLGNGSIFSGHDDRQNRQRCADKSEKSSALDNDFGSSRSDFILLICGYGQHGRSNGAAVFCRAGKCAILAQRAELHC